MKSDAGEKQSDRYYNVVIEEGFVFVGVLLLWSRREMVSYSVEGLKIMKIMVHVMIGVGVRWILSNMDMHRQCRQIHIKGWRQDWDNYVPYDQNSSI